MMTGDGALVGIGRVAEVFAHPDGVLKLYGPDQPKASAFREAANLARAGALGLPVPEVLSVARHRGRWGLTMARITGASFGEVLRAEPGCGPRLAEALARLHLRLNAAPAGRLPDVRATLGSRIRRAPGLGAARTRSLLERLAALPDGDRLCHGDLHPFNVLGPPDAPVVIDWLDAGRGAPAADICRSVVLMRPHDRDFTQAYLSARVALGGMSAREIMDWMPCTAAARLAEGVPETEALMEMIDAG